MFSVHEHSVRLKHGKVGLLSDTHGLLRPEALTALKDSELIIHAGDIGNAEIISSLKAIAPVLAIRGNNDRQPWARHLPDILNLKINSIKLQVIHDVKEMSRDPATTGFSAVVSGHSHMPGKVTRDGVIYLNPGSAGPRRFKLPVAVGKLDVSKSRVRAVIVELAV